VSLSNLPWIGATVLASILALVCAGGWLREYWQASARLADAVAARDVDWSGKLATANAKNEALAAQIDTRALQAAASERARLLIAHRPLVKRAAALEQALAALSVDDPVVFPRSLAKALHR